MEAFVLILLVIVVSIVIWLYSPQLQNYYKQRWGKPVIVKPPKAKPVEEPPKEEPPVVEPPVVEPPKEEPPVVEPPKEEPPVSEPPPARTPTLNVKFLGVYADKRAARALRHFLGTVTSFKEAVELIRKRGFKYMGLQWYRYGRGEVWADNEPRFKTYPKSTNFVLVDGLKWGGGMTNAVYEIPRIE